MVRYRMQTYCFSPPVMIATFIIEFVYLVFLLLTRKLTKITRLGMALLACLAIFQLSEFGICEFWGISGNTWAKIGFVSITMLPILGLHLVMAIANRENKRLLAFGYVLSVIWISMFLFANILRGSICSGNYIIFNIPDKYESSYYFFYDAIMALAIALAFRYVSLVRQRSKRIALQSLAIGYLSFIIPSIIFGYYDAHSGADSNLPSVMCGFAVLFATIVTFKVIPLTTKKK